MKFNKKAAMELGISTVVMLVIAIVIIGGGVTFIRGFFGKGTDSLGSAFEVADFGLQPDASKPLVLTDGKVSIKRGNEDTLRVGFYNAANREVEANIMFGECVSSVSNEECGEDVKPNIVSLAQTLEPGDQTGFATQVSAECSDGDGEVHAMAPGTYTCNLLAVDEDEESEADEFNELARTQIIFTVTS